MTRLQRNDWLEQGLIVLAEQGVDALTIDAMCKLMTVTKGSFYHHFKNRQAFLDAILSFWEDKYTKKFILMSQEGLNPQEKLERLHQLIIASYGTYEVNIRAWAQVDPLARIYQERVDQQRLNFLYELQRGLYASDEDALSMAHLQYTTLIGSAQMMPALALSDLENMYRLLTQLSISLQVKGKS